VEMCFPISGRERVENRMALFLRKE